MRIDNLARETHDTCPAKYDLRHRQHWSPRVKSIALTFGGVLHVGFAEWYRSRDILNALSAINESWHVAPPADDFRTLDKCLRTMKEYATHYPREPWHVIGEDSDAAIIERPFTLATGLYLPCRLSWFGAGRVTCCCLTAPTVDGNCPECATACEPIEYGGILDLVAEYSGNVYVVDHKTTSRMGKDYFLQFKPDNQMTGYIWAASVLSGRPVAGALINAIGIYKSQDTKFERGLTTRSPDDISRWLTDLQMACVEIKTHELLGHWPMRSKACTLYGRCEFHDIHSISDAHAQEKLLEQQYIKSVWDYEDRDDDL